MHFFKSSTNTKVLLGVTILRLELRDGRRDRHFTWLSEPRERLATCSAKGVLSFLS